MKYLTNNLSDLKLPSRLLYTRNIEGAAVLPGAATAATQNYCVYLRAGSWRFEVGWESSFGNVALAGFYCVLFFRFFFVLFWHLHLQFYVFTMRFLYIYF